jgi:hypothetical protein
MRKSIDGLAAVTPQILEQDPHERAGPVNSNLIASPSRSPADLLSTPDVGLPGAYQSRASSIRRVAGELGISRNTIRPYLKGETPIGERRPRLTTG